VCEVDTESVISAELFQGSLGFLRFLSKFTVQSCLLWKIIFSPGCYARFWTQSPLLFLPFSA